MFWINRTAISVWTQTLGLGQFCTLFSFLPFARLHLNTLSFSHPRYRPLSLWPGVDPMKEASRFQLLLAAGVYKSKTGECARLQLLCTVVCVVK
jgi:uncharacterized protein (DUF2237 family)